MSQNQGLVQYKQDVQALIQSTTIKHPSLKDKLNFEICNHYLRLPDESFGWQGKKGNAMSLSAKMMILSLAMKYDLEIGMGHIYFLGNKPYLTKSGRLHIAKKSQRFKFVGERTYRPFSDEEKDMYNIEKGDFHVVVEQEIEVDGTKYIATGYGILGAEECTINSYNQYKPGMDTKKNRMRTVQTRALNDLLENNLPLDDELGYCDSPDDVIEIEEGPNVEKILEIQATAPIVQVKPEHVPTKEDYAEIKQTARDAINMLQKLGLNNQQIEQRLEQPLVNEMRMYDDWVNFCSDLQKLVQIIELEKSNSEPKEESKPEPVKKAATKKAKTKAKKTKTTKAKAKEPQEISELEQAKKILSEQIELARARGGNLIQICGSNPLNFLEPSATMIAPIRDVTTKLISWRESQEIAEGNQKGMVLDEVDRIFDNEPEESPEVEPEPRTKTDETIDEILGNPKLKPQVAEILVHLQNSHIPDNMTLKIVNAVRAANNGKLDELQSYVRDFTI